MAATMAAFLGFPRPCRRSTSLWTTDRTGVVMGRAALPRVDVGSAERCRMHDL